AEAALREMKLMAFDIVLMDMEMPGTDGLEATRMIRKLPDKDKAGVPVIAMTGNVSSEDVERCRQAGMNDHVSKPINPETLRTLVVRHAPKNKPAAQAAPAPQAEPTAQAAANPAPPPPAEAPPAPPP